MDAGQKESHLNPPLLFRDDDGGWAREGGGHGGVGSVSAHTRGNWLSADVFLSID